MSRRDIERDSLVRFACCHALLLVDSRAVAAADTGLRELFDPAAPGKFSITRRMHFVRSRVTL